MADYRVASRQFSRVWRRKKRYSSNEIRWLARKRRLTVRRDGTALELHKEGSVRPVVRFEPIAQAPVAPVPVNK